MGGTNVGASPLSLLVPQCQTCLPVGRWPGRRTERRVPRETICILSTVYFHQKYYYTANYMCRQTILYSDFTGFSLKSLKSKYPLEKNSELLYNITI